MSDLHTLYTLGYTGRKPSEIAEIAKTLRAAIVDVRLSTKSRVNEWQGYALRSFLDRHGHQYHHIENLGNLNYNTSAPIEIKDPEIGCLELRSMLKKSPCVILCACAHVESCHRAKIAELMQLWHGARVEHIGKSVTPEANEEQLTLL